MLSAAKGKSPLLVFISFTRFSTNSSTIFKSANLEAMILGKQGTLLRFTLIHFDELQRPQEAGKPRRLFSYAIFDLSYDFFFHLSGITSKSRSLYPSTVYLCLTALLRVLRFNRAVTGIR